jgi:hypothetical protein
LLVLFGHAGRGVQVRFLALECTRFFVYLRNLQGELIHSIYLK